MSGTRVLTRCIKANEADAHTGLPSTSIMLACLNMRVNFARCQLLISIPVPITWSGRGLKQEAIQIHDMLKSSTSTHIQFAQKQQSQASHLGLRMKNFFN